MEKEADYIIKFRKHCEKFWDGKNMKYVQEQKAIMAYYRHNIIESILVTQHNMDSKLRKAK